MKQDDVRYDDQADRQRSIANFVAMMGRPHHEGAIGHGKGLNSNNGPQRGSFAGCREGPSRTSSGKIAG